MTTEGDPVEKAFYSTTETARLFNINRVTIYRWIKEGKVKAHRIGKCFKVPASEVAALLKNSGLSYPTIEDGGPKAAASAAARGRPRGGT
jgi:excisionase family DNA binding protein